MARTATVTASKLPPEHRPGALIAFAKRAGGPYALLLPALLIIWLLAPAATAAQRCQAPIAWRIGVVDAQFDVDVHKLHRMTEAAARRWNTALGRIVFVADATARFTVSMRYGLRQQAAEAVQDVHKEAAQREGLLDEMMHTSGRLVRDYNAQSRRHAARTATFNREVDRLERRIREHRGPLSSTARREFERQRATLDDQRLALATERLRLERSRTELEALGHAINARVALHNSTVTSANRTMRALPLEARQMGVTHSNGPRSSIDLLQYYDDEILHFTLLHELGHALGLLHVDDPSAVMHASLNNQTAKKLTPSDLQALRALCG